MRSPKSVKLFNFYRPTSEFGKPQKSYCVKYICRIWGLLEQNRALTFFLSLRTSPVAY
jgi:hypothetical protein